MIFTIETLATHEVLPTLILPQDIKNSRCKFTEDLSQPLQKWERKSQSPKHKNGCTDARISGRNFAKSKHPNRSSRKIQKQKRNLQEKPQTEIFKKNPKPQSSQPQCSRKIQTAIFKKNPKPQFSRKTQNSNIQEKPKTSIFKKNSKTQSSRKIQKCNLKKIQKRNLQENKKSQSSKKPAPCYKIVSPQVVWRDHQVQVHLSRCYKKCQNKASKSVTRKTAIP